MKKIVFSLLAWATISAFLTGCHGVSPDGDEALNAGVSVVAIVICAPTSCPYHEQSSTCGEEGFVDALDGATYESTLEEVLPEIG